ncbi:MAG: undecaprenyl-diphosphate phosphatase [Clostridiales bacterium]|nr:undecaprenyl-diphosphate phosphatase [Clostridiales bacterium]
MNIIQAIFLGVLQGLAEFLPISSSGHLIIFRSFFGMEEVMLSFDVFLHLGTLAAVMIVFFKDIAAILRRPFSKEMLLLIIATVPAALAGFLLEDQITRFFSSVIPVAVALVFTGLLLNFSDRFHGRREMKELSYVQAGVVGFFQAVAILPGISRSGSTIFAALACGMTRKAAARFSFLLSVIIILGAAGKQSFDIIKETGGLVLEPYYFAGMAASAFAGICAILFFLRLLEKKSLRFFAYYCWAFAAITIAWALITK